MRREFKTDSPIKNLFSGILSPKMSLSCLNFTITLENMNTPSQGMLLIAEPFLKDPNFKRTVVLLCEHQEAGSFGFVLNREIMNKHLEDLIPDLAGMNHPVYYGGPCSERYPALSCTSILH